MDNPDNKPLPPRGTPDRVVPCSAVVGDSNELKTPEPEKWAVVVVMGKDWGEMMRGLRDQATQLHIDAERSGVPSTWGISGRYAYWSGVGGRPSLDELARVVESAKSPTTKAQRACGPEDVR